MASQQATRRLILVAQSITRHASILANQKWEPRRTRLIKLLATLTAAAERGDPAAASMLAIVERATIETTGWARDWRGDLISDSARASRIGRDAADSLIPPTGPSGLASPALTSLPLPVYVDNLLAGVVAATTSRVQEAAAFGITENPRQVARRITQAFGTPPIKAQTIARTEMLHAYRSASIARYAENPLLSEWVWVAALDGRTCPTCWAMHGTIHPLSEPFGSHPNCRCAPMPVVPGAALPTPGVDLFAELAAEKQAAILGPGRKRLYDEGVGLADMVRTADHPVYGVTRGLAPIGSISRAA